MASLFLLALVFCVSRTSSLLLFGCQHHYHWLPGKTRLRNDLLCVEWDVRPCTLTHSTPIASIDIGKSVTCTNIQKKVLAIPIPMPGLKNIHFTLAKIFITLHPTYKNSTKNTTKNLLAIGLPAIAILQPWCTTVDHLVFNRYWQYDVTNKILQWL